VDRKADSQDEASSEVEWMCRNHHGASGEAAWAWGVAHMDDDFAAWLKSRYDFLRQGIVPDAMDARQVGLALCRVLVLLMQLSVRYPWSRQARQDAQEREKDFTRGSGRTVEAGGRAQNKGIKINEQVLREEQNKNENER